MKSRTLMFATAITLFAALAIPVRLAAQDPTFTTFDAPGAGTGSGQGTFSFAISPTGAGGSGRVDRISKSRTREGTL